MVFVLNAALALAVTLKSRWSLGHLGLWFLVLPYVGTVFGIVFNNRFPLWASRQKPKGV